MNSEIHWSFPNDALKRSVEIMKPHGVSGNEGLALWFGLEIGNEVTITHAVDLSGAGFRTSPLNMSISVRAMGMLTDLAEKLDRYLVGQIHSHPGQFLDLSWVDVENGIRVPNYLSLVCPYYAQQDLSGFENCGIHIFEHGNYRRLNSAEGNRRLHVRAENISVIKCEVES